MAWGQVDGIGRLLNRFLNKIVLSTKKHMTTTMLQYKNCDNMYIRHNNSLIPLTTFLSSVTFDSILSHHHNGILCSLRTATDMSSPIVYFTNYRDIIYSLTFLTSSVVIKQLSFTTLPDTEKLPYINYLINDTNRTWIIIDTLTHDVDGTSSRQLSNQILTLLRICRIDKEDYIKDPSVLSMKFAK